MSLIETKKRDISSLKKPIVNRTKFEKTILKWFVIIVTFIFRIVGCGKLKRLANLKLKSEKIEYWYLNDSYDPLHLITGEAKIVKLVYPYINRDNKIVCYGIRSGAYVLYEVGIFGNVIPTSIYKVSFKFKE